MKKISLTKIWLGATTVLLNLPNLVFATGVPAAPAPLASSWSDLVCVFSHIMDLLFAGLIILTVFFVVMAAYKYLTSAGEAEKISEANKQLLYAAVAIVIGLLAKGVPYIVATVVNANSSGFTNLTC